MKTATNPLVAILHSLEAELHDYEFSRAKLRTWVQQLSEDLAREAERLKADPKYLSNSLGIIQSRGQEIDGTARAAYVQATSVKRLARSYRSANPTTALPEFPTSKDVLRESDELQAAQSVSVQTLLNKAVAEASSFLLPDGEKPTADQLASQTRDSIVDPLVHRFAPSADGGCSARMADDAGGTGTCGKGRVAACHHWNGDAKKPIMPGVYAAEKES